MKRLILFILILTVLAIAIKLGYDYFNRPKNENELILYGNVDVRQVDISFRVPGQVEELFFQEGDVVAKGSLMASLNTSPYEAQVAQAAFTTKALKTNLENAEAIFKRRQGLVQMGSISKEDFTNTESTYNQLVAQYTASKAALTIAQDNLKYTKTYAPIDGIVLTRVREGGTVVRETEPIYTLSISSPVWIRAFINEVHLGEIAYGMEVEITTDNPRGHAYKGRIGFISPLAEFTPKTVETTDLRTDLVYRLRIYVDEPDTGLRQGMPVTARIQLKATDHDGIK